MDLNDKIVFNLMVIMDIGHNQVRFLSPLLLRENKITFIITFSNKRYILFEDVWASLKIVSNNNIYNKIKVRLNI